MNPAERPAYLKTQVIANFVINAVLNGVIAVFLYQSKVSISVVEMAWDVEITLAIIGFFVAWIAIASARKKFPPAPERKIAQKLTHNAILRALGIMLLLMVVLGGLLIGIAVTLTPQGFSAGGYILFKTLYTGVCAALSALLAIRSVYND